MTRVLIVEDDPMARQLLEIYVNQSGRYSLVPSVESAALAEFCCRTRQSMIIDNGYLAAMSATCTMDVQMNKGIKNMLFGGEGMFNTVITGPGVIVLQTMPAAGVAGALLPFLPVGNKK